MSRLINFKKTSMVVVFSCLTTIPFFAGENASPIVGSDSLKANEELGKVYTPARTAIRVRQNLITPFYAYYGQLLPATLSTGGKMASSTYGTGLSWNFIHPKKTRIALTNIDYRRTDYRFSGGAESPFEHTDTIRASTYQEFINLEKKLALVAILSATVSAEDKTDLTNGLSGLIGLGGKKYFSSNTSLTLGGVTQYRPELERWYFYPLISFDWRITPNLNFRTFDGLSLTWDVNGDNSFLLDFSASYKTSVFAIDSDTSTSKGAYFEKNVPISIAGTLNFSENLFLNAGVTLNTWSRYRLYRSGHKTDEKFSTDPTLGFFIQAGVRF